MNLSYLEIEVTDHCNLRCTHCTHHSPYMDPGFYPLEELERDLAFLSAASISISTLRIMGGEPLLNPKILECVRSCRKSSVFGQIGICTNGTLLDRASLELFPMLDFLHVLLYPTPARERVEGQVQRLNKEFPSLPIQSWSPGIFWTEDIRSRIDDPQIVRRIWEECGMKHCNAIYRGYFVRCVQTYRKPRFLNHLGVHDEKLEDWNKDAVDLSSPTLAEDLAAFVAPTPKWMEACNWCLGQSGKDVPHVQKKVGDPIPDFDVSMLKWGNP